MKSPPAEVISVIAGGWSLTGVDLDRIPGFRIGVNDSAWRARVQLGVTMDRLFFEGRRAQLEQRFPADMSSGFYYREGIDKAGTAPAHWVRFDCDHRASNMSLDWKPRTRLNGMNSGICAINLAYRMKPERVILWGFDMCREPKSGRPYYHEPYPWARPNGATSDGKFLEWMRAFHDIRQQFDAAGIELVNASPGSAINTIKKIDPGVLLK